VKGDLTPRAVAAMIVSIERMLMEDARGAVLRGDAAGVAKRRLSRACDRAFELLESGVRGYGGRGKRP